MRSFLILSLVSLSLADPLADWFGLGEHHHHHHHHHIHPTGTGTGIPFPQPTGPASSGFQVVSKIPLSIRRLSIDYNLAPTSTFAKPGASLAPEEYIRKGAPRELKNVPRAGWNVTSVFPTGTGIPGGPMFTATGTAPIFPTTFVTATRPAFPTGTSSRGPPPPAPPRSDPNWLEEFQEWMEAMMQWLQGKQSMGPKSKRLS